MIINKQALISQYFGLGDCIFSQGIANHFIRQGYRVTWPVMKEFVDGLQSAYPYINWVPITIINRMLLEIKDDTVIDGVRIIPIRFANELMKMPSKYWMRAKYDYYGLDYKQWKDFAGYIRDFKREQKLMDLLGIVDGEPFVLVNNTYRSDMNGKLNIDLSHIPSTHKIVEIRVIPGFSLFDYSSAIEKATEIQVVNSSSLYLFEMLNIDAKKVHIYARPEEKGGFPYVDYLMTKPYVLHG